MNILDREEDYILFLCIHLASVDGSLHPNEVETIQEKMIEWFPGVELGDKFSDFETGYRKLGPVAAEDLLVSAWASIATTNPGIKTRLFPILIDIINSDARVHEEETRFLKTVRSWLKP